MDVKTYSVPGVSCGHCKQAIEGEVSKLNGVSSVDVDLDAKTVSVKFDGVEESAIFDAIDEAGYDVAGVIEQGSA